MRIGISLLIILIFTGTTFAAPALLPDEREVNFGISPMNSKVMKTIVLRSVGDEAVKITRVDTYCDCIVFDYDPKPIEPGDSIIATLTLKTPVFDGVKTWGIHVLYNDGYKARFNVQAQISQKPELLPAISVKPYTVTASQFADNVKTEFSFEIANKLDREIPLTLLFTDEKYYLIDFPSIVEPNSTAIGRIVLTDEGIKKEFESNMIFEFIDERNEQRLYSIPVRRKIFK